MMEPFLYALPVALWGHRSPKIEVDLDPSGMGSYSTLIVTMGLSSTVNPQYIPRQTDGRTDVHAPDNSPSYALMHYMHYHRRAKNEEKY